MPLSVGIYLFDQVEILDFSGPFEVFTTATRVHRRLEPDHPVAFTVFPIAEQIKPIRARGGLSIIPQYDFETHPPVNLLIIPGGIVEDELDKDRVIQWITKCAQQARITASVCTGAFLLGKAGLLDGRIATTHWEDIADFQNSFPNISVKTGTRWVDTGATVTSAGISAGIDMSLHLVERLKGVELAIRTARQMEFVWDNAGLTINE